MTPTTLVASVPIVAVGAHGSPSRQSGQPGALLLALAPPGPSGDRSPGWQGDAGGGGISGGGLLLLAAYAAIWLVAFGMIAMSLLRQGRMNARIEHLTSELAAAGERASASRKERQQAKKKQTGAEPKPSKAKPGEDAPDDRSG